MTDETTTNTTSANTCANMDTHTGTLTPTAPAAVPAPFPVPLPYTRTVRIGSAPANLRRSGAVYVEIEIANRNGIGPELSISGTAPGCCGQIRDTVQDVTDFAPGWTPALRDRLLVIWDTWHLNGLRANCRHQIGPDWDPEREAVIHEYSIDWDEKRRLERAVEQGDPGAERGAVALYRLKQAKIEPFRWTKLRCGSRIAASFSGSPAARATMFRIVDGDGNSAAFLKARTEEDERAAHASLPRPRRVILCRREQRQGLNWLRPEEHPDGFLCKPCPVCGYKYGSAWLHEPLPADVIAEVLALPGGGVADDRGVSPSPEAVIAGEWLERAGVTFEAAHAQQKPVPWHQQPKGSRAVNTGAAQHWIVTLRGPEGTGQPLRFDFWNSINDTAKGAPLQAHTVLACLAADRGYTDPDEIAADLDLPPSRARKAAAWGQRINRWLARVEAARPGTIEGLEGMG